MYYLDLSSGEMNGDTVAIIVKTSSVGAKTTPIVMYPEELGDIRCDVGQISGDATAADNAELFFDGTGYAGTNNVIPTVTTVTNGVNVTSISGDSVAADNAELFFDGTGYAGTNNVIPTVTTVTNGVNVTSISGDSVAADNAELFFDGTGYAGTNNVIPTVTTVTNGVNVTSISGDSVAADNAEAFFDGTGYAGTNNVIPTVTTVTTVTTVNALAADSITSSAIAASGATEVAAAVWDSLRASYVVAGSFGQGVVVNSTATAERDALATAMLKIDWTGMTGEASRSVLQALRFLRNKWDVTSGTLTVKKEDDSTSAWTSAITSNSSASPIVGSDPA
jgi:hypothetical protein